MAIMKRFSIHVGEIHIIHDASTLEQAKKKALELARKFDADAYSIFEHKTTVVIA